MSLITELTTPATGGWPDVATSFLALWAAVTALMAALYAGTGLFFTVMNARRPDRKIQKSRINAETRREILRAPASLATLSFYFAAGVFAQVQGWTVAPLELSWWTSPLLLLVSVVLYDAWFYWAHRLLHWKPMWRFHALHHRSVTPTVWSNHSESFVEASLLHVYYTILPFLVPIPWQMMLVHKVYDQITGMVGHAGYEHFASPVSRTPWPLAGTVFHDQHHSSFKSNYGHTFSLWDRVMGTLHPRYDRTVASFEGPVEATEGAASDPASRRRS